MNNPPLARRDMGEKEPAAAVAFGRPDGNPSACELLKMSSVLAPLRFSLFIVVTLAGGVSVGLAHRLGARGRWLNFAVRAIARALLFIMGFHTVGVRDRRSETDKARRGGQRGRAAVRIVVANHLSLVEVLHLVVVATGDENWMAPLPQFVSKASILRMPLFGYVAQKVLKCIAVHRTQNDGDPASPAPTSPSAEILAWVDLHQRRSTDNSSLNVPTLVIFPEGTTSNGTGLLRFRSGAFLPGLPVHPILYRFSSGTVNARSFIPTFESIYAPFWMWRLLSQPWNTMHVEHCPPIIPTQSELKAGAPYTIFRRRARIEIASALGLPMYDFGYGDKNAYHDCLRNVFSGKEYDAAGVLAGSEREDPLADRVRLGVVRACTGLGFVRSLVAMLLTPQPFRRTCEKDE